MSDELKAHVVNTEKLPSKSLSYTIVKMQIYAMVASCWVIRLIYFFNVISLFLGVIDVTCRQIRITPRGKHTIETVRIFGEGNYFSSHPWDSLILEDER